jgi:site-specific recombinase XerD
VLTIPLPKGGRTRHVVLSRAAIELLRARTSFLVSAYVYPGTRPDRPLDPRSFVRWHFDPALRKAGIQGVSWHKLRHTAASRRVMAGVDLVTVKDFLGHSDIQTTMRYAHLAPAHVKSAINLGSLGQTLTASITKEWSEGEGGVQVPDFMARPAGIEPATLSLEG